jgi:DNA-binding MarR family transcriptional regulator
MPTKKKAKHAAKKAASKKRAAKKKTTAKKAAPKRVRDKDGLLKNGSEAKVLAMIRRKTGASVGAICGRLNMKPATVRVTVRNLRGKDFKIRTGDDGKYHIG